VTIHDTYFGRAFSVFESVFSARRLTVYLTWDLKNLPSYGDNVVAVVLGDEWCRVPAYLDRVLVAFKCYGSTPNLPPSVLLPTSYLQVLVALQHARIHFHRLPGVVQSLQNKMRLMLKGRDNNAAYPIPLGYANQVELPIVPIEERTVDVFFAGSLSHNHHPRWSPLHWLRSPKHVARARAIEEASALQSLAPELNVDLRVTSDFAPHAVMFGKEDSDVLSAEQYSSKMMDARICLAPRGTSPETFRYFEALRSGCVVISDVLPQHWYYDGSPAIELQDWAQLPSVVLPLLDDKRALVKLHRASLDWWSEKCSELALGHYMADMVNRHLRDSTTDRFFSPLSSLLHQKAP
jgi:hypothetical protein